MLPRGKEKTKRTKNLIFDLVIISLFIFTAVVIFNARWCGQSPVLHMSSDAGDMLSYAAALDHPELFKNDASFSDQKHLGFYQTIHINLIRWLNLATQDYGLAYLLLFIPFIFLQLLGFYLLGMILFDSRFWGLLLSLTCLGFYYIPGLWTYWGLFSGPQTRYLFQSLLPYFLLAACLLRDRPRWWPLIMLGGGLLTLVHPPAGPVWAFAVWLGLALVAPPAWSWGRWAGYCLLLGLIYLASALPFVLPWLGKDAAAPVQVDHALVLAIAKQRIGLEYFDTWAAVKAFFGPWKGWLCLYLLGGTLGLGFMAWAQARQRGNLRMALAWVAGVILIAVLFPWVHKSYAAVRGALPWEIDFIRSVRFLIPLMFIFCLWPLAWASSRLGGGSAGRRGGRAGLAAVGVAFLAITLYNFPSFQGVASKGWEYLRHGRAACAGGFSRQQRLAEVLEAVKKSVPPGGRIFCNDTNLQVMLRHYALRPLVWAKKDMGIKYYNDGGAGLPEWERIRNLMYAALGQKDPQARQAGIAALAQSLGASYLLVDWPWSPGVLPGQSVHPRLLWVKHGHSLLKLD